MTMAEADFDEVALTEELKGWWKEQVEVENDPFAVEPSGGDTIFDVLPMIDSLGVVTGIIAVQKHVPFKVTPKIIRPGGYNSFEDLIEDFIPKLRAMGLKEAAKLSLKIKDKVAA
ncbi:MAG: hypothetical protein JWM33_251 [Caulobacteraceae bacterium]|nr:hypothetical protein [Caulobacteraceae bacterium]